MIHAVVDASVAVKWFLPPTEAEQGHDEAVTLLKEVRSGHIALREPPHWLAEVAADQKVPLLLMHIRGTPETMQADPHYDSLFSEILHSLRQSIQRAESAGVDPDQIVIDPGIGFGKTLEHNLFILKHLSEFRILGKPILLGTSRKSFIGKVLHTEELSERLEGTLASIAIAVLNGAHIVRCHDVLQAKKAIAVADAIRLAGN